MTRSRADQALRVHRRPPRRVIDELTRERVGARLFRRDAESIRIGRFAIQRQLGEGGSGAVYEAIDPNLDRPVAIKLLSGRLGETLSEDKQAQSLRAEARLLARLAHPNIVRVFEVDEHEGEVFLVMELIEGTDLQTWLGQRGMSRSAATTMNLLRDAALGLQAAHRLGVVHGDLKPSNILIDAGGTARLADFGLASPIDPQSGRSRRPTRAGTPAYMAPELFAGEPASVVSDVFAFCVTVVEVLGGDMDPTRAAELGPITRLSELTRRDIPARLRNALRRGLQPDHRRRLSSMDLIVAALEPRKSPWRLVAGATAILSLGGVLGVVGIRSSSTNECDTAQGRVQRVWGDEQRQQVAHAFEQTGLAYAATAAARTSDALDRYAAGWARQYEAVCEASLREGAAGAPAQFLCLDRDLGAIASLVEVFESGGQDIVSRATSTVSELPTPSDCRDDTFVAHEPTEHDQTLLAELARLRMKVVAGASVDTLRRLEELRTLSESAHSGVRAQVLYVLADAYSHAGDFDASEAELELAFKLATRADDRRTAASAALGLVFVVGYRQQRTEPAETWLKVAAAEVERLPSTDEIHRTLWISQAALLTRQRRHEETLVVLGKAREHIEAAGPPWPTQLATVLGDMGATHVALGRFEAAGRLMTESIELSGELLGDNHPSMAVAHFNRAALEVLEGRLKSARVHAARSLAISSSSIGRRHDTTAMAHAAVAELDLLAGNFDDARRHITQADQIISEILPDGSQDNAKILRIQGELALATDDPARAVELLRRAVEKSPRGSRQLAALGRALHAAGEADEAIVVLQRAQDEMLRKWPESVFVLTTTLARAAALRDVGRTGESDALATLTLDALADRTDELSAQTIAAWRVDADPGRAASP